MAAISEPTFRFAASTADVPPGAVKAVEIDGVPILLCNSKDQLFAVINRCSHADEKLECGRMKAGWIACPVHGARFDLATGAVKNPPATRPIQTFPVRLAGDAIEVAV